MRPTGYSFIRLVDENLAPEQTTLFALRVDNFSGREWALPGSARRARTRGEADQEEGPVDLPPAERVRHGRRTPAFERSRDCKAKKGPGQKGHGWIFSASISTKAVAHGSWKAPWRRRIASCRSRRARCRLNRAQCRGQ